MIDADVIKIDWVTKQVIDIMFDFCCKPWI